MNSGQREQGTGRFRTAKVLTVVLFAMVMAGTGLYVASVPRDLSGLAGTTRDPARTVAFAAGEAAAKQDLARGILAFETYGTSTVNHEEYASLLRQRYGIEVRVVGFCDASEDIENHARGYNNVMYPEIQRRFGTDIWDKAQAEMRQRTPGH